MGNLTIGILGRGCEGKSTTAHYLAAALAQIGKHVTVVSTDNFGDASAGSADGDVCLDKVMAGKAKICEAAYMTKWGYRYVAGGEELDTVALPLTRSSMGAKVLGNHLSELDGIVLIDGRAYNLDFWSDSLILASDKILAVTRPFADSAKRLDLMVEHIAMDDEAKYLGFIATMVSGTKATDYVETFAALCNRPDYLMGIPQRQGRDKRDVVVSYCNLVPFILR